VLVDLHKHSPANTAIRDQTKHPHDSDSEDSESPEDAAKADGIAAEDPFVTFKEEREGWHGYVEWEDYPEKKEKAAAILAQHEFPPPPEFQLGPIPETNPVLEGVRWKEWHRAIGGPLFAVPEESWARVIQEKHPDMLHLLEFPYNGEPPKRLVTAKPITPNELHFVRNHGGIPDIDAGAFELKLDGLVKNPMSLKMADLMNEELFPRQTNVVTIQCSGTRRIEQIQEYAGEGDEMINAPWAEGAIGTAKWTGVSLKKVIKHCGGLIDEAKHIELYGAETYFKQVRKSPFTSGQLVLTSFIGTSDELRRVRPVVEGQSQRSHPRFRDE
jgi:sulfite oxidase